MYYERMEEATFVNRPNRFIAHVKRLTGEETTTVCHVKNTGRCKELLIPGATVYIQKSDNPNRKTAYDLIGVKKGERMINMDSQAPNQAVEEWLRKGNLFSKNANIRREVVYGESRFDFYVEDGDRRAFLEVKGVTLEKEGIASFPDAPTERGVKHIRELVKCIQDGYEAYLLFVVQMKDITEIRPNEETHPAFGEALREAAAQGVTVLAYDCYVSMNEMVIENPVKVNLV